MTASRKAKLLFAGIGTLFLGASAAHAAPYQVYRDATCAPNAQCGIDFPNIGAGKTVTLSNFSCRAQWPSTSSLITLQLVVVNNQTGARAFAVTANATILPFSVNAGLGTNQTVAFSNDTIQAVGRAGQHFKAYVQVQKDSDGSVGTVTALNCGISGTVE